MEWVRQLLRLFGWKNQQFESLTETQIGHWKVRVWRSHETLERAASAGHKDFETDLLNATIYGDNAAPVSLAKIIMRQPGVSCVAVVDANGNGVSAYPDWH